MKAGGSFTISVIIPAYNAAPWIGRAIDSVLAQTAPVNEIIIVDDQSKDNTAEIVAAYGEKVRYIKQSNGGPAKARNTGLRSATGEWLALLDADDWWMPDRIEAQLETLNSNPEAILVYTSLQMISDDGTKTIARSVPASRLWPQLRYSNPITPSSVLVKRDALLKINGFNEKHRGTEDWEAWVRLSRIGKFVEVEKAVTCYRVAPTSLSANGDRMFKDFLPMLDATLVSDLGPFSRCVWKRKIRAYQAFSAGMTARMAGDSGTEMKYLRRSVMEWPSPFWKRERWKAFLVTARALLNRSVIKSPAPELKVP